jgi:hypothetical protein
MGTSTNRRGISPATPLLPDWLDEVDEDNTDEMDQEGDKTSPLPNTDEDGAPVDSPQIEEDDPEPPATGNRFDSSQRGFREAVRTGSNARLARSVKNYFGRALGGPKRAARRMQSSSRAVARLGGVLSDIQQQGLAPVLAQYNLSQYIGRPAVEILSALMDVVCGTSSLLDNAVTKYAYAQAIVRVIDDNPTLDLERLTGAQVAEMMAVFLEESLVYRLICDVGRSLTVATSDPAQALQAEEQISQIVSGLIRSTITPELQKAVQDTNTIDRQLTRIYRIAIKTILDS